MLRPALTVACAAILATAAVVLMLGYGGSWQSVVAGCSMFALGVHLAGPGIGFCLYGGPRQRDNRFPDEAQPS